MSQRIRWSQVLWLAVFCLGLAAPAHAVGEDAQLTTCLKTGKNCSGVDLDLPGARQAYEKGCAAKDYYSCFRLGQYWEVKENSLERAVPVYERACKGGDRYGCKSSYDGHMELCYLRGLSGFCGKKKPRGEFRAMAFLETLDPRYQDAMIAHDYESGWAHEKTARLYKKRLNEKNPALLRALDAAKKSGRHDGADAEALDSDIAALKR